MAREVEEKMVHSAFMLPVEMRDRLRAQARYEDVSMATLVRRALRQFWQLEELRGGRSLGEVERAS